MQLVRLVAASGTLAAIMLCVDAADSRLEAQTSGGQCKAQCSREYASDPDAIPMCVAACPDYPVSKPNVTSTSPASSPAPKANMSKAKLGGIAPKTEKTKEEEPLCVDFAPRLTEKVSNGVDGASFEYKPQYVGERYSLNIKKGDFWPGRYVCEKNKGWMYVGPL